MTKKDYDFICYIIDKNTVNVAGKYEDYKKINEKGIDKIKEEIRRYVLYETD